MKRTNIYFFPVLFLLLLTGLVAAQVKSVRILLPKKPGTITLHASQLLGNQITKRCNATIVQGKKAGLTIELIIEKSASPESFRVLGMNDTHIQIIGNDENGLLYGVGKFLRSSRFDKGGFTAGAWRGNSAPKGKVRGMYFASHFGNFYEAAPIAEVQQYVDELALWGVNYLVVHFPLFQFTGFEDPAAQQSIARLKQILQVAKSNGMKVGLLQVANGSFKSTQAELLNVAVPDELHRRGNFGINLNPANPKAHEVLKENWIQLLAQFNDVAPDVIVHWPYDEGGCGCAECWPWGARGYPKLSRDLSLIARQKYPGIKVVLSTWVYDTPEAGEWIGLTQFLQDDSSWLNYIMADSHEGYPRFPLDKAVPGGLPLLNFPEISMWGQGPWGGYGSNPLPNRLQRLWNETENKLSGGFPYSEGIYEDINKVICSQLYWDGNRSTPDILKEYIAYEFSPDIVDSLTKAIEIFESNHLRDSIKSSALEAFHIVEEAEQKLTPQVRRSWRWRIIYLRALIDKELFQTKGKLEGETLKNAFNELTTIYHAENSHSMPIHPPVIK